MSGIIAAAGITAGAGLLGGFLSSSSSKKAQRKAEAFERQRIQMTVADAKKAGIHPLAALGAGTAYTNPYTSIPSGGMANAIGEVGQSLGQAAVDYGQAKKDKAAVRFETQMALKKFDLDARETEARIGLINAQKLQLAVQTKNYAQSPYNFGVPGEFRPTNTVKRSTTPSPVSKDELPKTGIVVDTPYGPTRTTNVDTVPDADQEVTRRVINLEAIIENYFLQKMKENWLKKNAKEAPFDATPYRKGKN